MPWPRACCAREGLLQAGELLGWEQCQERSPGYIHERVGHDPAVSLSCAPGRWPWGRSTLCPEHQGQEPGALPTPGSAAQ